jgi:hypothetical protein
MRNSTSNHLLSASYRQNSYPSIKAKKRNSFLALISHLHNLNFLSLQFLTYQWSVWFFAPVSIFCICEMDRGSAFIKSLRILLKIVRDFCIWTAIPPLEPIDLWNTSYLSSKCHIDFYNKTFFLEFLMDMIIFLIVSGITCSSEVGNLWTDSKIQTNLFYYVWNRPKALLKFIKSKINIVYFKFEIIFCLDFTSI